MKVQKKHRILLIVSSFLLALAAIAISFMSVRGMFPFLPIAGESMYPSLKNGDLIMVDYVWPNDVQQGDIIVFSVPQPIQKNYNYPPVLAHRVTGVRKLGEHGTISPDKGVIEVIPAEKYNTIYYTMGDNSEEDPFAVWPPDLKGKVNRYYPGLGLPLLFFQSKQGLAVVSLTLILLVGYLYWDRILSGLVGFRKQVFAPLILESQRQVKHHKPIPGPEKISDQVFDSLILENQRQAKHLEAIQSTLERFASAFNEYSETLRTHTNIIQELSIATHELKRSTVEYNETSKLLSELLEQALVVRQGKRSEYEESQSKATTTAIESHVTPITWAPPGCYYSLDRSPKQNQTR